MKVEKAVRTFLRSLVEFLNNKKCLNNNDEIEFEIDPLPDIIQNIIQNIKQNISNQEILDKLNVIFKIIGEQEEDVFEADTNKCCKIISIYLIDDSTEKFNGKVRDFSFADINGRGAVISKSFFVNKDALNENDLQELKGNIFELIVYLGSRHQEMKEFLNFLFENTNKNILMLTKKDNTLDEEELYSFLYLSFLAKGYKTKLDDKVVYSYQLDSDIESQLKSLSVLKLSQFFEIIDVFDEYQHATDILSRFLKLYQMLEYLLIRIMLVNIQKRTGQHKQFLRELMKLKRHEDFDKKLFRELFDNEKDDLRDWLKKMISTNQDIKTEIEKYFNRSIDINQNSPEYWLNLLADLFYQLRNSIVHNKESEYHITIHTVSKNTVDILMKILLKFEKIILEKVVGCDEKISYSSRELMLY